MKENRAYYLGLMSIGMFLIAAVLGTTGFISGSILTGVGYASLGVAIGAFIEGRKELLNDPKNKKSRIGYIIGIVMLSFQVLGGVILLLTANKGLIKYLDFISWLVFFATLIILIVFAVRKKPLKILFIIIGCCFMLSLLGESITASSPGLFLGMTGLAGFFTAIVVLIVFAIQKKPLNILVMIIFGCFCLFVSGFVYSDLIESPMEQTTAKVATAESAADQMGTALAESMQKYETMSIETFESLPRHERLIYAQYLINKTNDSGNYEKLYGGENAVYALPYKEATINDSGQDIMDNVELKLQYAALQHIDKEMTADTADAKKLLTIPFLYIGADEFLSGNYLNEKEMLERNNNVFVFSDDATALETSDLITYNYDSDTDLPAKVVKFTDNTDGVTKFAEYALTQVINPDKSVQSSWSLIATAATAEDLENVIASLDGIN
ncbi:MFS transporter [Acetobacterium bakii]|uniref:Uncharacterized protein n=1 Tax=Acetobacterium bakii TaxID=52689 RepID=A0A0L6TVE5_9FIRM|nr:MFS transporter [Acetobacterium bakii]KNZ40241.1 hypothetical protein AKG39_18720 [Acetobacterium bakii]